MNLATLTTLLFVAYTAAILIPEADSTTVVPSPPPPPHLSSSSEEDLQVSSEAPPPSSSSSSSPSPPESSPQPPQNHLEDELVLNLGDRHQSKHVIYKKDDLDEDYAAPRKIIIHDNNPSSSDDELEDCVEIVDEEEQHHQQQQQQQVLNSTVIIQLCEEFLENEKVCAHMHELLKNEQYLKLTWELTSRVFFERPFGVVLFVVWTLILCVLNFVILFACTLLKPLRSLFLTKIVSDLRRRYYFTNDSSELRVVDNNVKK